VRITGQLINSQTGAHLWADRFDGDLKDIFDLQDQVTTKVVGIVAPKLDQAEIERAKRKPVESLDAYDCFLRGLATMYEQTRASFDEAIRFFHRAIELDPEFSTPYGMIARCHSYLWGRGWTADKAHAEAEIRRVAGRVAVLGQDDAAALCPTGFALVRVCKDDETGLALIDQGLAANPNLATGWAQRGAASVFLGQSDAAIEQLTRAMRLNPLDPETYFSEAMMAYACLTQGRYDEALKWAAHSLAHRPNYYVALRMAAIANALSGRIDEARKIMPQIRQLHPESRLSNLKDSVPSRKPEHLAMMVEGLRLAGLPE
jgi:adenylate cyclase